MTDDEIDAVIAGLQAPSKRELYGLVVDFFCADCGATATVLATWRRAPVCCGWEMVDSIGSVRPVGPCG
jgi:hypothetical protein